VSKVTLSDIPGGYASLAAINARLALIEAAFDNTVSRDGTVPNSMSADLDMNGNDILNVNSLSLPGFDSFEQILTDADAAKVAAEAAQTAAELAQTNAEAAKDAAIVAANSVTGFYDTLAELKVETDIIVGDIVQTKGYYAVGDGGGATYTIVASGTGTDDGGSYIDLSGSGLQARAELDEPINVKQFGARGEYNTSYSATNQTAIQNAVDYVIARGERNNSIYFPRGRYTIGDPGIDVYRASSTDVDIEFNGDGADVTILYADFYGAWKGLFQGRDPSATDRVATTRFRNMGLGNVSSDITNGVNPILIDITGFGEGLLDNIKFFPSNNTHFSGGSMQNCRGTLVQSRFGGHSFVYKNTDGVTFTITGVDPTSRTITASSSIFTTSPTDVGLNLVVVPTDGGERRKYKITAVASGTSATIENDYPSNTVDAEAFFEHSRGAMNAGSNLLYVNASYPCFSANDVGRIIYVQEAKDGSGGRAILRARVKSYESANSVRLGDEWGNDLSNDTGFTRSDLAFAVPTIDIWTPTFGGSLGNRSVDNSFEFLHIENYKGLALGIDNAKAIHIAAFKAEGLTNYNGGNYSGGPTAFLWIRGATGFIAGDIANQHGFGKEAIYVSDLGGTLVLQIPEWQNYNGGSVEKFVKVEADTPAGGRVVVNGLGIVRPYLTTEDAFFDNNSATRLHVFGVVCNSSETTTYLGTLTNKLINNGADFRFVRLAEISAGSVPNNSLAINDANGNLIFRDNVGTLHTVVAI